MEKKDEVKGQSLKDRTSDPSPSPYFKRLIPFSEDPKLPYKKKPINSEIWNKSFKKYNCPCAVLCLVVQSSPPRFSVHGDSPGKDTGVGCHAFSRGIFPTQGSNPGLLYCRCILYQLSYREAQLSPRLATNC